MPSPHTSVTTNKSHKKKEISYDSLPLGTKNRFKSKVIPLALDTIGAMKPWNIPGDDAIIEIWNIVFSDDFPIDQGDTECYHFTVAKTLVSLLISVGASAVPLGNSVPALAHLNRCVGHVTCFLIARAHSITFVLG
jgi:hypothetical protein